VQRLERQAWHLDYRKLRRPGLGHPGRQQRARAVKLLDDKVDAAPVVPQRGRAVSWRGGNLADVALERIALESLTGRISTNCDDLGVA
jgi:hypothetical protein